MTNGIFIHESSFKRRHEQGCFIIILVKIIRECVQRGPSCTGRTISGVGDIQKWSHQLYYVLIHKHKGQIGFSRFVILRVYLRCFPLSIPNHSFGILQRWRLGSGGKLVTELTTQIMPHCWGTGARCWLGLLVFLNKDMLLQPKLTSNYVVVSALNYSRITCLHDLSAGIMGI